MGICEEEGREVREEKIQKESKMAKNLDLTGFDGNILAQNLKTQKGSLGIMEEKTVITEARTVEAATEATVVEETVDAEPTAESTESTETVVATTTGVEPTVEVVVEDPATEEIKLNTLNSLKYLISEIYSHSYILNKATGADIFIDERVKSDLAEAVILEEALGQLKEAKEIGLMRGLEVKETSLLITAFDFLAALPDTAMRNAVGTLLSLLEKSVIAKSVKNKNVNLHKVEVKKPENEKFALRTWLTRLGWKGSEGKMERNLLYRNLNGNTAFCTEESKIRWEAKHKKGKRTEPTVMGTSEAVSTAEEERKKKVRLGLLWLNQKPILKLGKSL